MKAIIIDDEVNSAEVLRLLVEQHCPQIDSLILIHDPKEAVEVVRKMQPDLIFLDVEMAGMNGFEVQEAIKGYYKVVIFTTAHSQYAIRALRSAAFDYLLKPIEMCELNDAINRAFHKVNESSKDESENNLKKRVERLELAMLNPGVQRLAVQSTDGYNMISYDDIIRLEAESNYTHVHTLKKKYTVARLLRNFEEQLLQSGFIRVHNSHLVNVKHIQHYQRGDGGYLIMSDKSHVEVSRSRKKEVLRVLLGEE
ncbi:MAG: response regulator transcription factor [Bacteroidetes bacterium]|nr:response regulator transcription factor [Bacteroidota bacterium]